MTIDLTVSDVTVDLAMREKYFDVKLFQSCFLLGLGPLETKRILTDASSASNRQDAIELARDLYPTFFKMNENVLSHTLVVSSDDPTDTTTLEMYLERKFRL